MADEPEGPPPPPASRQSEELLRLMIGGVQDFAIFATDAEGRILSWNPGVGRLLGYEESEWVGLHASVIFTPEDRERGEDVLETETAAREGRAVDERWHVRRDGTRFWADGMLMSLRDERGALRGFAKILRDNTAAKEREELLRRKRELLDATLDSLPGVFYLLDGAGRFLRWNANFERVTGYTAEEMAGMNPLDLFRGEDRRHVEERIREVFATGRSNAEAALVTKSGRSIPHFFTGSRFTYGGVECLVGVGVDITERRLAEEERARLTAELERQRSTLEQVLQQMPSGVAIAEAGSGKLLFHNDEAVRLIRHPLRESETYEEYTQYGALHTDGTPYRPEEYPIARALIGGEVVKGEEMTYRRGDGTLADFSVNAAPIRDPEGRTLAVVSTFADISELKRAQRETARLLESERDARRQAEEANRLKDEFLATLSHELRTPLTAMLGWARLLRAGGIDDEMAARALESIERNANAQRQLIDDILDVSRIVSGKLRLDVRPVSVVSVVEAAVDAVRPAAVAKQVELHVTVAQRTGPLMGDPDRLRQVVWNLLANAIKFTPAGGHVWVRAQRLDGEIRIEVSDTGRGIAPDFLPHVFERFRQADASTTRAYGGLGLGLSIVRHIVELHGGTVRVESAGEGLGATFTVTLPVAGQPPAPASSGAETNAATAHAEECPPSLEGLHVLVLDDEADTREVIAAVLSGCGARVTTAASAREALASFGARGFDVIISDIGMPGVDGYEFIRGVRAREREAGGRQTPAIALTAYAREEDRRRAFRAGFQMHLSKPVEPAELTAVVASFSGRTEDAAGGRGGEGV